MDYKRASAVSRRMIEVDVPATLVARKGTTQLARRRCQAAQDGLREAIARKFEASGRRPFRSEVAVHLEIAGIGDLTAPKACRTVKALVDAMKGSVVADDRAVELLEVRSVPGALSARISIFSVGEYADRYDVLRGLREKREDDDSLHGDIPWRPWTWDRGLLDGDELERAREALQDFCTPSEGPAELHELRTFYARRVAELERRTFTMTPYQPTDRPGKPNLAAHIWAETGIRGGANTLDIPAPCDGEGSWTEVVGEAWRRHLERWRQATSFLKKDPLAIDIAVGKESDRGFDVDNLAARVLRGMRRAVPGAVPPDSYRVYRRADEPGAVVVTLHHPERAEALRRAMTGASFAILDARIDPDAPIHRRRSTDDAALEDFKATFRVEEPS
jgi:hypothetical protein